MTVFGWAKWYAREAARLRADYLTTPGVETWRLASANENAQNALRCLTEAQALRAGATPEDARQASYDACARAYQKRKQIGRT